MSQAERGGIKRCLRRTQRLPRLARRAGAGVVVCQTYGVPFGFLQSVWLSGAKPTPRYVVCLGSCGVAGRVVSFGGGNPPVRWLKGFVGTSAGVGYLA